jgi:hypothetical protein
VLVVRPASAAAGLTQVRALYVPQSCLVPAVLRSWFHFGSGELRLVGRAGQRVWPSAVPFAYLMVVCARTMFQFLKCCVFSLHLQWAS